MEIILNEVLIAGIIKILCYVGVFIFITTILSIIYKPISSIIKRRLLITSYGLYLAILTGLLIYFPDTLESSGMTWRKIGGVEPGLDSEIVAYSMPLEYQWIVIAFYFVLGTVIFAILLRRYAKTSSPNKK